MRYRSGPPQAKGGQLLREVRRSPFDPAGIEDDHSQLVHDHGRAEVRQRLPRELGHELVHADNALGRDVVGDQSERSRASRRSSSR